MRETGQYTYFFFIFLIITIIPDTVFSQQNFDKTGIRFYEKRELNWGAQFQLNKDREELITDVSKNYEELSFGEVNFQFNNRRWTFLDFKQEQLVIDFEVGPILGNGNWSDSNYVASRTADQTIFGLRLYGSVDYINRYYYSNKSFTLVQINAFARYDIYSRNSEGTAIDSNGVSGDFDVKTEKSKLRYGFMARAGWGSGRLNPVNHLMLADYLFDKYYKGRTFSKEESDKVVLEIEGIKNGRTLIAGHDNEKESEQMLDFLNQQMFLTRPDGFVREWKFGEFLPRFSGSRVEIGPFFKYYNREPDFIYGGYIQYNNEKYRNYKWNRKFNVALNYNWYKKQDWMRAEIELGWSYFMMLKNQFDFGLKYVPGITLNYFENIGKLNHAFIPYVGYYSQLNESIRINLELAYRIVQDEQFMLPGPEFSLSVYRSRY